MAEISKVTGMKEVSDNLKRQATTFSTAFGRGIIRAGLRVQRESQLEVPVEFGFLKASAFTRKSGSGLKTKVQVGYTAAYAAFIHERVEMKWAGLPRQPSPPHIGLYWGPRPRGKAKFLEDPVRRLTNEGTLVEIVRKEVKDHPQP